MPTDGAAREELGAGGTELRWPEPESADLGRYLEDTITIDWQTPAVSERASGLLAALPVEEPAGRLVALFEFVRDEVEHVLDLRAQDEWIPSPGEPVATCSASSVLRAGQGLCYAQSHLLAALLRFAGFPTGFCYARLVSANQRSGFVLHGFNAVWWSAGARWLYLDASQRDGAPRAEVRFEAPWALPFSVDEAAGESLLPAILRRPAKRVVDLLERAPDFEAVHRNLPDAL